MLLKRRALETISQRASGKDIAESMRKYDAVFFDAANTLLYPYPSVGDVYAEVAARYGVVTTGKEVGS